MTYDLVIKNGTLVTASHSYQADVAIRGERIAAIGHDLQGAQTLDASGKLVTPGAVDIHVHLSLDLGDGLVSTDDFFTGTQAAAYGGTTSVISFVHPTAQQSLIEALTARQQAAATDAVIDYGFHLNLNPQHLDQLDTLPDVVAAGVTSFKLYMAYAQHLNDGQLLQTLRAIAAVDGLPVVHAENWQLIQALVAEYLAAGKTQPAFHAQSRPALLEAEAVSRVIDLAGFVGVPLLLFHIGNAASAERIAAAQARGQTVYAETCPHYLLRTVVDYERPGADATLPVCAPPLRSGADVAAMWDALADNTLQLVSSDHAPFSREQKARGVKDFSKIPGGMPSVEVRFPALYGYGVRYRRLTPARWVDVCCTTPARLLGLERKGQLAPGFDADVVIFDPERPMTLSADMLHENVDWTPYEGMMMRGWPETVISRGEVIVADGTFTGVRGRGQYLHRTPQALETD